MTSHTTPAPDHARAARRGKQQPFGDAGAVRGGGVKQLLVHRVYQQIMDELDAGDLMPGSRVIAAELAQRMGLSRAPVREALAVLAGQGLVELLPDRGAVLRLFSPEDLADIYEVTAPIAAIGLRCAAINVGRGRNAERIKEAMEAIRSAELRKVTGVGFFLVLNDFHYLINELGNKTYLNNVLSLLNIEYWNRVLAKQIDLTLHAKGYVTNYGRITDAVLAGDAPAAEAIMHYHAQWSTNLLKTR